MDVPGLPLGLAEVNTTSLKQGIHCHRFFSSHNHFDMTSAQLRSREYRFTHMKCSLLDIPFLSEAFSGERI